MTISADAVSSARGIVRFRATGPHGDNRIVTDHAPDTGARIDVTTTSIDEFCASRKVEPAFMKIDVEGAELDVLQGARHTIAARGGALRLYIEMHPRSWPAFGSSRDRMQEELARQRLRAERIDGNPDIWDLEGVCLRLRRCAS